jgi:hypothetical protein
MLDGQWNVPMFGGQWNVPMFGGQWNVPMFGAQWNVLMLGWLMEGKEKHHFHLFSFSTPTNST